MNDLRLSDATLVMGVLNLTPDSFYAPSRVMDVSVARRRADEMIRDGAQIIDVGAESSRPGAASIDADEELRRLLPVVEALKGIEATISVDTVRADVARQAIAGGATLINDISALRMDPDMAGVVAETGAHCVLMHMQGDPAAMQKAPRYTDLIDEISAFFEERIEAATAAGIREDRLWLDPGFGFGKTVAHNLELLRRLDAFSRFGRPLLVGTSNKSTIGAVLELPTEELLEGTAATVAVAILKGAAAVRVHDVKAMARVARMCDAIIGRTTHGT